MLNVEAQGMKSFGVWLGKDDATNDGVVAAWKAAKKISTARVLPSPKMHGTLETKGSHAIFDLPMKEQGTARTTNNCVDVISDVEDSFNWDEVVSLHKEGKYNELSGGQGWV